MKWVEKERQKKGLPPPKPFNLVTEMEKATEKAIGMIEGKQDSTNKEKEDERNTGES